MKQEITAYREAVKLIKDILHDSDLEWDDIKGKWEDEEGGNPDLLPAISELREAYVDSFKPSTRALDDMVASPHAVLQYATAAIKKSAKNERPSDKEIAAFLHGDDDEHERLMIRCVKEFLSAYPDAEFGPAHVVLSDYNWHSIDWCLNLISGVLSGKAISSDGFDLTIYADHSENQIMATGAFLRVLKIILADEKTGEI